MEQPILNVSKELLPCSCRILQIFAGGFDFRKLTGHRSAGLASRDFRPIWIRKPMTGILPAVALGR